MTFHDTQPSTQYVAPQFYQRPSGRSMLGRQADSRKPTAPTCNFGQQTTREAHAKIYLSQEHLNVENRGREGPGPIYKVPDFTGKEVDSQKRSIADISLGSRQERFQDYATPVPGPGWYDAPPAMGRAQPLAGRKTAARLTFPTTRREDRDRLYVDRGHLAEKRGTLGAPPGAYGLVPAMGRQPLSGKRTCPTFTWQTDSELKLRYLEAVQSLPSVARYDLWATMPVEGSAAARQHQDLHRSQQQQQQQQRQEEPWAGAGSVKSAPTRARPDASQLLLFRTGITPGPGAYD